MYAGIWFLLCPHTNPRVQIYCCRFVKSSKRVKNLFSLNRNRNSKDVSGSETWYLLIENVWSVRIGDGDTFWQVNVLVATFYLDVKAVQSCNRVENTFCKSIFNFNAILWLVRPLPPKNFNQSAFRLC